MRSKTGEDVFKRLGFKNIKSAGTKVSLEACPVCFITNSYDNNVCRNCGIELEKRDQVQLDQKLIDWADIIFVMEQDHFDWMNNADLEFNPDKVEILNIQDAFQRGHPYLISVFEDLAKEAENGI
jgi:predicted protein tyrosine phosphatase